MTNINIAILRFWISYKTVFVGSEFIYEIIRTINSKKRSTENFTVDCFRI